MTSTVLDVTVLLLCVSASVVALGATGDDVNSRGPTADDVADRLVTETVTVTYESSASPSGTRTVHATRAELLAILAADGERADAGSGASDAFSARSRAAIGDGLGPRTRIDVRAVTVTDGNDTEVPSRPTSATGTPWSVELRGDRSERTDPRSERTDPQSERTDPQSERTDSRSDRSKPQSDTPTTDERVWDPITIGMNPPRDAAVTAAIVTQPAPSEAETVRSVRIVVRRW